MAYADYLIGAEKVIQVLQQLEEEKGVLLSIITDNGLRDGRRNSSVKIGSVVRKKTNWAKVLFNRGKPMQNGYNERLNRTYREDLLDAYFFAFLTRWSN